MRYSLGRFSPQDSPPHGNYQAVMNAQREDAQSAGPDWSAELARHERWLRTIVAARCGEPQAVDEIMQELHVGDSPPLWPMRRPPRGG